MLLLCKSILAVWTAVVLLTSDWISMHTILYNVCIGTHYYWNIFIGPFGVDEQARAVVR